MRQAAQDEEEYQIEREKKIQNLLRKKRAQQVNEEKATQLKLEANLNELVSNRQKEMLKLHNKVPSTHQITSFSRTLENVQVNEYNNFERDVRGENQKTKILTGTEYGQLIKDHSNMKRTCILK